MRIPMPSVAVAAAQRGCSGQPRQHGVTLVELLVALSVAAVLLAVGVPSFVELVARSRMTAATNDMLGAVMAARSEAIKRGVPTTLCRTSEYAAAQPVCGAGSGFEDGWIVFAESGVAGANGAFDADDELVLVGGPAPGSITIRSSGATAIRLSFTMTGLLANAVGASLWICDDRGADAAVGILIARSGRPRVDSEPASPVCP